VAATAMNHVSSRSHAIFTLKVTTQVEDNSDGGGGGGATKTIVARFNLVDLAGSERQASTLAEGTRLKEASGINKSLSTLGLVIQALVDRAKGMNRHVHYRDSKITFLLRDSLGGNSKTTMLCNVSQRTKDFGETLSSLRFAQRAKEIPTHAQVNEDYSLLDVKTLKATISALRQENSQLKASLKLVKADGRSTAAGGLPFAHRGGSSSVGGLGSSSEHLGGGGGRDILKRYSPRSRDNGVADRSNASSNRWVRASTGDFFGDNQAELLSPMNGGRRARNRAEVKLLASELSITSSPGSNSGSGGVALASDPSDWRKNDQHTIFEVEDDGADAQSQRISLFLSPPPPPHRQRQQDRSVEEALLTSPAPASRPLSSPPSHSETLSALVESLKAHEKCFAQRDSHDRIAQNESNHRSVDRPTSPAPGGKIFSAKGGKKIFQKVASAGEKALLSTEEVAVEGALLADLKAAVFLAQQTAQPLAQPGDGSKGGRHERLVLKLEGTVNRLEVEKTELEDECDSLEANLGVMKEECQDLASQVSNRPTPWPIH